MVVANTRLSVEAADINRVCIRLAGLPLQLWIQNVFMEVKNDYGDWIQTEEERELRNHLK